jgi:long-chain acyl-CoA synthetase
LHSHPGVIECAVAAVPDDLITNRLVAHVVVCDGTSVADLSRFCRERLPAYMLPEHYKSWDTLPRTSTGKIDRQSLREVDQEPSTATRPSPGKGTMPSAGAPESSPAASPPGRGSR